MQSPSLILLLIQSASESGLLLNNKNGYLDQSKYVISRYQSDAGAYSGGLSSTEADFYKECVAQTTPQVMSGKKLSF